MSKSFLYRKDAETWARTIERELDNGCEIIDRSILTTTSLTDLMKRYRDTVTIKKKRSKVETYCIDAFLRHKCTNLMLSEITPKTFADYRDERLSQVKPATICREFTIYQHAFQIAINEWDIPLGSNPLHKVKWPKYEDKRNRRLEAGELVSMIGYCKTHQQPELLNAIILAIETGMRRGELLRVSKEHFNSDNRTLFISITKSGYPRTIPLTTKATEIISKLEPTETIYSKSTEGFVSAWQSLIKHTEIKGLRFHDLRHEAISRFFEMGLSVPEVALISGHRDYRMLQRYTHLRPEQVVNKLL
ncbi:MAG: site-specific integrase [Emcibacteraceae bacterium]|nr:site-specific integrase [Emcibacteraceae bacterium]